MSESSSSPSPAPLFHEKLWPAWWIWLLVLGTGAAGFVALAPVSITAGIVAGIAVVLLLIVLLTVSTPAVTVTSDSLRVGRATIEREFVGEVSGHRGEDATFQRGRGLNATAFLCLRGWIDPVVRIEITDPQDTTPYWLASTRRPEELVAALDSVRA
ncbi:DUF3093 domain-containing protein [Arthrobacter halodurans]|uniref:DUF3093 domain-containing protein n=1 Tax=Arthrobacter halodurans TaxID=516699 RepID=A0ABV4UIL2_9MICC